MVTIKTPTKALFEHLKKLKVAIRGNGPKAMATTCEITVIDGKAIFAVPGAIFTLECETKSTCKAVVPFLHFMQIIRDTHIPMLEIQISKDEMQIHNLKLNIRTTFFETDRILRTIHLPINYTDRDLLLLTKQGYTDEELIFNKLLIPIEHAEENLKNNIDKAFAKLKQYKIPFEELEELVKRNLFSKE